MNQYENFSPEIYDGEEKSGGKEREDQDRRALPPAEELIAKPRSRSGVSSGRTEAKPRGARTVKKRKPKDGGKERTQGEAVKKPLAEELKSRWGNMRSVRLLLGVFMGLFGAYLAISFISYLTGCIVDQSTVANDPVGFSPEVINKGGEGGARISELLINDTFGLGALVIVFWLFAMAMKQLAGRPKFKSVNFTIKCLVALITLSLLTGLVTIGLDTPVNWGGLHGRYVNDFIIRFLGWTGAVFVALFMLACFVVICMRDVVNWVLRLKRKRDERKRVEREAREAAEAKEAARRADEAREAMESVAAGETAPAAAEPETVDTYLKFDGKDCPEERHSETPEIVEEDADPDSYVLTDEEEIARVRAEQKEISAESEEYVLEDSYKETAAEMGSEAAAPAETSADEEVKVVNIRSHTIRESHEVKTEQKGPASGRTYHFPPTELLRPGSVHIEVDRDEQIRKQDLIRQTLLDFGIPIESIDSTVGPTVTLYEVVPSPGVKVSKINNLVDDIALRLKAKGVRIIAPIPGRGTVGIEVANEKPQIVSMRRVLNSEEFQKSKHRLPIALGATIENKVYVADLAKMPHLLVAGATGQGKSVGLNAIITSLLYSKTPDELKFVMVDPKMVEFSIYSKIENMYLAELPDTSDPIITETDKVVSTMSSLCEEMENRYQLLKGNSRNVEEYNEKFRAGKLSESDGHRFLPYIVVIIDEFCDLIMLAGKEVEMPIARLAQKARAVGIHVIIATQRPSTTVITGNIKANFPARISFKVSSAVDSKTILDQSGSQRLIGRGDMLISNNSELVRVQCAFVDTPEVEEIVDYVAHQPYAPGPYILPEPKIGSDGDDEGGGYAGTYMERDPLLPEAARSVVMASQASTSSLQRRFSIGYNRAGKIMDQLEALGIVGPSNGSKSRSVLVDSVNVEEIISRM